MKQVFSLIVFTICIVANTTAQTVEGDILRGQGAFAVGAGWYNLNTAKSNAINVDAMRNYNEEVRGGSLSTRYDENTMSWMSTVDHEAVMVQSSAFTASALLVDFSKVKQVVIDGYSVPYTIITGLARVAASFLGIVPPPKVGSHLNSLYLVAVSISGDREQGFQALLQHARDKAFQKNCHGVVCGLNSQSSFNKYANRRSISNTKSILYAVAWDESVIPKIDNGVNKINVEVATL